MPWLESLPQLFSEEAPLGPGDLLAVAFSGGTDSTALLWGLARWSRRSGESAGSPIRLLAVHLDHALDPGSAERALRAERLAGEIGVPFLKERLDVRAARRAGESLEAAARRVRYAFLERVRRQQGARYVVTAHHRDDQAETVLLRLRFGSGLAGLAGIRPRRGAIVRPLLGVPRAELAATVAISGLIAIEDPTNRDLSAYRNRIRHGILPALETLEALETAEPDLAARLAGLAGRARRATGPLERKLAAALAPAAGSIDSLDSIGSGAAACDRQRFASLPAALQPFALSWLTRRAGAAPATRRGVTAELVRQLASDTRVELDAGGGWVWRGDAASLRIERREKKQADFSYTLQVPGEVWLAELSLRLRLDRQPVAPWMFRGEAGRAALALPLAEGERVTIRNRRPGDRLRPLGGAGTRRLKEVLIDRHLPRAERARLPLLCFRDEVAWVPGVTIDHRFRIQGDQVVWVAELIDEAAGIHPSPSRFLKGVSEGPDPSAFNQERPERVAGAVPR